MVATAATLFAVNGSVSKVVLDSGLSSLELAQIRATCAALGFLAFLLVFARPRLRVDRRELLFLAAFGVIGVAIVQWLYFVAIHNLPVGVALLIEFTAPLFVALFARFVYKEQIRRRIWVAVVLCLTGLTIVVESGPASRSARSASPPRSAAPSGSPPTSSWPSGSVGTAIRCRSRSTASSSPRCCGPSSSRSGSSRGTCSARPSRSRATSRSTPRRSGSSSASSSSSARWSRSRSSPGRFGTSARPAPRSSRRSSRHRDRHRLVWLGETFGPTQLVGGASSSRASSSAQSAR